MTAINANLTQGIRPAADAFTPTAGQTARFLSFWLALAAALLGGAIAINDGRLHWQALQWLAMAIVAMTGAMLLCRGRIAASVNSKLLESVLLIAAAWQIVHLWLIGPLTTDHIGLPMPALRACLGTIAIGLILVRWTRRQLAGGGLVVGGFAVAACAVVWTSPNVLIDVLMFQKESAAVMLDGGNPYSARYYNIYHPSAEFYGPGVVRDRWLTYSFPYPPLSLLLVLPGQLLGDVRYAHAAALTLAGALLMLAGRNRLSILAAALLLTSPRSLLVVRAGWTEPLLIFLAASVVLSAMRCRNALWVWLGLLLAVKQYLFLLLPLTKLLEPSMGSRMRWRRTVLTAVLLAIAISAPFVVARPQAAFRSIVQWQLVQPFRYDALSFAAMRAQLTQDESGGWAGFAAATLALGLALWKAPRNVGGMMAAAAVVFVAFFALNKQAFCNYYLFVIGLCACAIVGLQPSGGCEESALSGGPDN